MVFPGSGSIPVVNDHTGPVIVVNAVTVSILQKYSVRSLNVGVYDIEVVVPSYSGDVRVALATSV